LKVLGIETSCDETAASVVSLVDGVVTVHTFALSSQRFFHEKFGGVVPELASREHLRNLRAVVEAANEGQVIDAIGVTAGPGLKGCLMIGTDFARGLGAGLRIPVYRVNHIEAHILSCFLEHKVDFPYICLVASGGHTEIQFVKAVGEYELFSKTTDDAAGEAFDKSAVLLGLPGGLELANLADSVTKSPYSLPIGNKGKDEFSFSGLKTAASLLIKKTGADSKAEVAFAIQEAIVGALLEKVKRAETYYGINRVVVAGGVSANRRLREVFNKNFNSYFVSPRYCTDNGAMIALCCLLRMKKFDDRLTDEVFPRWPV
jgi:N6-L-threonylcarbamoyladenine synthase